MQAAKKKYLIGLATYNEVENIPSLIQEIHRYLPQQVILVIDDNSPDGTGEILDKLSSNDSALEVIHRPGKLGLGTAHLTLMNYALTHQYDYLITMDADFSHQPRYLPQMVELLQKHLFVTGSRYMQGGKTGQTFVRKFFSLCANLLTRCLLGIPLHECTTSYRGFDRTLLEKLLKKGIQSEGYSFFVESIFTVSQITRDMAEFPIFFEDRSHGVSKINKKEILKSLITLGRLFCLRLKKFFKIVKENPL